MTTPLAAYERHFVIGPFAAYELMQRVVPDMTEAGYGSIVNITSGASRMPGEGPYPDRSEGVLAGYGGGKAALEHLTLCAAYELADRNIAVNALAPSKAILTPGVAYYSKVFEDLAPEEDFAEATVRLALATRKSSAGRSSGISTSSTAATGPLCVSARRKPPGTKGKATTPFFRRCRRPPSSLRVGSLAVGR